VIPVELFPGVDSSFLLKQGVKKVKICTDSRAFQYTEAFVCLKGEKFDGAAFLDPILPLGSPLVIYNQTEENELIIAKHRQNFPKTYFHPVPDTLLYLQEVSAIHRKVWQDKGGVVIGITGSNGKTTTKEMLYHLLNGVIPGQVVATDGNFNNHIGVPLTLSRIDDRHKIAIVEMGTNHPGEIEFLCTLANPQHGILTSVGRAHLEFLKDLDGVLNEKGALYRWVKKNNGKVVVNGDDEKLATLAKDKKVIGVKKNAAKKIKNENIVGEHNLINLALTYTLSLELFPDREEFLKEVAKGFAPRTNRSSLIKFGDATLFLDAYNANPDSMKKSLIGFIEYLKDKKVALKDTLFVLGDMNELGNDAPAFHQEMGTLLNDLKVPNAVFIGRFAHHYLETYKGKNRRSFPTSKEFYSEFHSWALKEFKYFFLKASRSVQLENLVDMGSAKH